MVRRMKKKANNPRGYKNSMARRMEEKQIIQKRGYKKQHGKENGRKTNNQKNKGI